MPPPRGAKLTFTKPSPPGRPWKLCYKFADEPWKLFNQVTLEVKELKAPLTRTVPGKACLSDSDVQEIISDFDKNGDGVLDLDELATAWTAITGGAPVKMGAPPKY